MADPFIKKQPTELEKDTVNKIIENTLNKRKRPVKFTWKGAADLLATMSNTPLRNYQIRTLIDDKLPRVTDLAEGRDKPQEKDYIDFFQDVEKGLFGGVQDLGYAIGDLLTSGIDAAADTNLTEELTKVYEENKIKDPETLTGEITKLLTQYGVPGGGVFKVLNRVKALSKARKVKKTSDKAINAAKRIGYMSTAFAATDFIASEPDRESTAIPLVDTEGLSGRDLALARLTNRIRYGAEGAAFGAGFTLLGKPLGLGVKYGLLKPGAKVAGIGLKAIDKAVVTPITYLGAKAIPTPVGKKIRNASNFVIDKALSTVITGNPKKQLPEFANWRLFSTDSLDPVERKLRRLDNFLSYFRSLGKQTGLGYQISSDAARAIKGDQRKIEKYLESIEKKAYNLAKSFEDQYNTNTTSKASQDYYLDQVLSFLKGQTQKSALPKELQTTAQGLSDELARIKKNFGNLLPEGDLKQYVLKNLKSYMRRSFSIFTNPAYQPDKKIKDSAVGWVLNNVIKPNKDLRESAIKTLKTPKMSNEQALKEMAETTVDGILRAGKQDGADPLNVIRRIAKKDLRLDTLVRTGDELPDVIKKLLGEENNLRSSVMLTSNNAITQSINKMSMDKLADIGLKEGWLFSSESAATAKRFFDTQKIGDLKSLGLMKSNMSKLYATPELVQAFRGTNKGLDRWIQSGFYRNLLQLKVAAQYGKTVLSPVTQVRNVTSAGLFPLANGHIGGRASVSEAIKMVADDIFGAGKVINEEQFIKNIENKIRLGVLDENVVASELKAVLQDIRAGAKVKNMDSLIAKLANTKMAKTATRIYAGGDNLWKWYGHEYVKSQMKGIYNSVDDIAKWYDEIVGRKFDKFNTFTGKAKTFDDAIDEAAAWQIRNTYPTYSLVPQIIQDLRRLPFGNFVSFPAEMIRTTYNILSLGAKEALSSNAKLRQIGYRRLIGASVVLGGAEKGVTTLAQNLTGTTKEQIDAYKRSLSAPWNSRAAILPINKWVDGVGKAINFSYFSPYDVVTQPVNSLLKTIEEGNLKQQDVDKVLFNIINPTGDGPVGKLLQPFISEAIAIEKWNDVAPAGFFTGGRGGVTKTGSKVYSENDDPDVKITKSIAHIIKGVRPTAIDTGSKIIEGVQKDIKRGGQTVNLQDELLALLSGVRIINVNVPQSMEFKITDYNSSIKKVTESEKFYSLENFRQRGPLVMAQEFRDIQDEAFKINQNFYFLLQDALTVGVPEEVLIKLLRKRRIPYAKVKKLLRGQNIPFTGYEERMKLRVKRAEAKKDELGEEGEVVPEYFYPKNLFKDIVREYKEKSLIPQPDAEEEEGTFEFEEFLPNIDNQQSNLQIQTPPLGPTPMPNNRLFATAPVNTNLTRTENALLSNPLDREIARRT